MAKKKVFQISGALSEGLQETISAAHSHSGELRIEVIPLKKIECDPENPRELVLQFEDLPAGPNAADPQYLRKSQERESLLSLAKSIESEGVINPVMVYKFGDKYRLVAGERRTLASILAGKEDIQAKILDKKPSPLKLSLLQWIENIEREDLTLWERVKNLEKIIASHQQQTAGQGKVSPTLLSQLIGCSVPHAMNYCALLYADDELKQSIANNTVRNLEKAALVAKISSQVVRAQALQACVDGVTLKDLKRIAASENLVNTPSKIIGKVRSRGRQAAKVNLGSTTNPRVIRCIIESVTHHDKYKHLKDTFKHTDWQSYNGVTNVFKQFLKVLEATEKQAG